MWHVYYDASKQMYQLTNSNDVNWLAIFKTFDMAYDYVTRNNKTTDRAAYSRWTR